MCFPGKKLNEDEAMMYRHGDEYGDGVPWAANGTGSLYHMVDGLGPFWIIPETILKIFMKPQILIYFSVNSTFNSTAKK